MIDISIIIVSWNAKDFVDKCLTSIYDNPTACTIETIVVDNASTDGVPDMVKEKYPQVCLIQNAENLGFAKANNIGIENSKGKYLCLINSDAVVLDNCLDLMVNFMNDHPQIGVLGPKVLNSDGSLQPSCREFPTFWKNLCRAFALDKLFPKSKIFGGYYMMNWSHDTVKEIDYLSGCFMMVRRSAIDQTGLLDINFFFYAEDMDWCKRFWETGWQVIYFPKAKAIHHGGSSSDRNPIDYYIQLTNANLTYYSKHHGNIGKMTFIMTEVIHQAIRTIGYSMVYLFKTSNKTVTLTKIKRSIACLFWIIKPNS